MARPLKDGLDYFPKDSGFYRDRKIRALIGRFGSDGAILYDYILCEAYGDKGYYVSVDDSFQDIAAADLGMSPEKIGLILDYLLNKSMLLDGTLFKAVKVLTSHGIQTRYQEAVRQRAVKRGVCVDGKLWLLSEAETESFIQVRHNDDKSRKNYDKSEKNHSFSDGKSLKESKGKESNTTLSPSGGSVRFVPPLVEEVREYCNERKNGIDAQEFVDFYTSKGWMIGKNKMKDWKAAVRTWEKSKKGKTTSGGGYPDDYFTR